MTTKEKADSIFQQMYKILWHTNSDPIHCKQCAIVAVDEILKAGKDVDEFADNYWLQVKQEIEKL
jgi:hypothetical protein